MGASTVARPRVQGFSPCGCQLLQCPQLLPEPLLYHAQLLRGLRATEGLGPLVKFLHGVPIKNQFLFQGLSAHKAPQRLGDSFISPPIYPAIDHTPTHLPLSTHPPIHPPPTLSPSMHPSSIDPLLMEFLLFHKSEDIVCGLRGLTI